MKTKICQKCNQKTWVALLTDGTCNECLQKTQLEKPECENCIELHTEVCKVCQSTICDDCTFLLSEDEDDSNLDEEDLYCKSCFSNALQFRDRLFERKVKSLTQKRANLAKLQKTYA